MDQKLRQDSGFLTRQRSQSGGRKWMPRSCVTLRRRKLSIVRHRCVPPRRADVAWTLPRCLRGRRRDYSDDLRRLQLKMQTPGSD